MAHGEIRWLIPGYGEKDSMGESGVLGFTVHQWWLEAPSFNDVGGALVPSISAILLSLALYALVSIIAHFPGINVDFALNKESRGETL